MKISALGVVATDVMQSIAFYTLLGFRFSQELTVDTEHVEADHVEGDCRLMIDTRSAITAVLGEEPRPANHATFAIAYPTADEVDAAVSMIEGAGYTIIKQAFDAPWEQRYATVADPDDYQIDLYAPLPS